MNWKIVDGRHRYVAAVMRGHPVELRCDCISATGHALRVLRIEKLELDESVQLDFAFSRRRAERMAREWNDRLVGVLTVVDGDLSPAERAEIKLGLDRDRRGVSNLESFLISCEQGDVESLDIVALAEKHGYDIGKLSSGKPYTRIGAVAALQAIYRRGPEFLDRSLALGQPWYGEPETNLRLWLDALYLLCRDGYDEALTPNVIERWQEVVPAKLIRIAKAETAGLGAQANKSTVGRVSYRVAEGLRKAGKLRQRPLHRPIGKGGPARPIHEAGA